MWIQEYISNVHGKNLTKSATIDNADEYKVCCIPKLGQNWVFQVRIAKNIYIIFPDDELLILKMGSPRRTLTQIVNYSKNSFLFI